MAMILVVYSPAYKIRRSRKVRICHLDAARYNMQLQKMSIPLSQKVNGNPRGGGGAITGKQKF